jgi:hypothetical protein
MRSFREEIEHVINCHSKENGSNTPDFVLAQYLEDCLAAYDRALVERERWYGRPIGVPSSPQDVEGNSSPFPATPEPTPRSA